MDLQTITAFILVALSSALAVLGWSLRANVASFRTTLEGVARDVRSLAAQASTHETKLAVIDTRLANAEGRIGGLEDRERGRAA